VVLLGPAPAAWAQTTGGTQAATGSPLKLSLSMMSALESATMVGGVPVAERGRVNVGLGYGRANRRNSFDLSLGSVVPYATGIREDLVSYAGSFSFSSRLGRRTDLQIAEAFSERPLDGTGLSGYSRGVPGAVSDALSTNASLSAVRETRSDGAITLSRTLSRRTSAALSFTHTSSRSPGLSPAGSQLAKVQLERRVSPSGTFHAGYGFGSASFSTSETAAGIRHDIDLGFNFARPLPFSGRTILETDTGSTLLNNGGSRKLRLVLRASLLRDLAARWSSRIEYSRPMQFVAGFQQPFLSDALRLSVDGQMSRDWFLSFSGGVARGSVGFDIGTQKYDSYNTSVRVYRQIARTWRVEVEGFSTRFRYTGQLSGALPPRIERQGVRAGLSWSAALFRRG
jgi:hypothetical protein